MQLEQSSRNLMHFKLNICHIWLMTWQIFSGGNGKLTTQVHVKKLKGFNLNFETLEGLYVIVSKFKEFFRINPKNILTKYL